MNIKINDYIEGIELVGANKKREMSGWVDKIHFDKNGLMEVDIQCDDKWSGARGNTLYQKYGEIKVIDTNKPRPKLYL